MSVSRDELRAYALGELPPPAARRVEAQLRRSARDRAAVVAWREDFVAEVEAAPPVAPPAHVLSALRARLAGDHSPRAPARAWMLAASVSGVLCVAALGWGWQATRESRALASEQQLVTRWLARADVRAVPLTWSDGSVRGRVLVLPDGRALFVLPREAPPGKTYQAWVARNWTFGEKLTSVATSERRVFEGRYDGNDYLCVSVEASGGSAQPTGWLGGAFL